MYIYTYIYILFHCHLLQDIDYSSPCYILGPCCLPILYNSFHLLIPSSHSFHPLPLLPSGNHRSVLLIFESLSVLSICPFVSDFILHI